MGTRFSGLKNGVTARIFSRWTEKNRKIPKLFNRNGRKIPSLTGKTGAFQQEPPGNFEPKNRVPTHVYNSPFDENGRWHHNIWLINCLSIIISTSILATCIYLLLFMFSTNALSVSR